MLNCVNSVADFYGIADNDPRFSCVVKQASDGKRKGVKIVVKHREGEGC